MKRRLSRGTSAVAVTSLALAGMVTLGSPAPAAVNCDLHAGVRSCADRDTGKSVPARAAADSSGTLVFIRNHNVWISRPNGTGARAVTRDGTAGQAYRTPTQDDGGHIYAVRGRGAKALVSRFDQQGRLLKRYAPPTASLGPDFVSVSPDGMKLAYETMFAGSDCSFTPCHTFFQHAIEYAAAPSGSALRGAHAVQDADFASWAGNSRTVLQTRSLNLVSLHRSTAKEAVGWFASCLSYQEGCDNTDTYNFAPAVNRQGTRFATSRLEDNNGKKHAYLLVFATTDATTADRPAPPGAGCAHPATAPSEDFPGRTELTISAPSFSPGGRSVAFGQRTGTSWSTRVYTPVIGDCAASDPVTVLRNAAEPHWSAAPLSRAALRWKRAAHPGLKGKARVGATLRPALRNAALRKGFAPRANRLRFQWLRNGHRIKRATTATYRVRKVDRRKRLKVRITGVRNGLTKAAVTTRAKRVR